MQKNEEEELLLEEKEKRKLMTTKEFSNYFYNKKYYNNEKNDNNTLNYYNNLINNSNNIINNHSAVEVSKDNKKGRNKTKSIENAQSNRNMEYLKALAFNEEPKKVKNHFYKITNESRASDKDKNDNNESTSDVQNKYKNNTDPEVEKQLIKVHGKVFHMQNEIDLIAKEILGKCKYYKPKKQV